MFWRKKEQGYIKEIKELYRELKEKNDLIFELLEKEKELHQQIYDKNTEIIEWMKLVVELKMNIETGMNSTDDNEGNKDKV